MRREDKEETKQGESGLREYTGELETKQSNILWPDAHQNSRGVDELLWKGNKDAPPIQRAGIAVFGFIFLIIGVALFVLGLEKRSVLESVIAALFILLAARLFRNVFRGLRRNQ
jgi:hypothetical protein